MPRLPEHFRNIRPIPHIRSANSIILGKIHKLILFLLKLSNKYNKDNPNIKKQSSSRITWRFGNENKNIIIRNIILCFRF